MAVLAFLGVSFSSMAAFGAEKSELERVVIEGKAARTFFYLDGRGLFQGVPRTDPKSSQALDEKSEAPSVISRDNLCQQTSHPVDTITGEKFKHESDFISAARHGLGLQRTYRSFSTASSMFGPKWLSSAENPALRLEAVANVYVSSALGAQQIPGSILLTQPDGSVQKPGGGYDNVYPGGKRR